MDVEDWIAWFTSEESKLAAVYLGSPERLLADFRQERAMSDDYAGRELFELLQNAGDAAALNKCATRVRIEMHSDGILIANTGACFQPEGVRSLLMAHISPKPDAGEAVIGQKGLGFRAMLNWSRSPIIVSGSLRMAFVPSLAQAKLDSLLEAENGASLRKLVFRETERGRTVPLPCLAFPVYARPGELGDALTGDNLRGLLMRCEALLKEGFDTAIALSWKDAGSQEAAERQVRELKPEALLFVPSLETVEVWREDARLTHWRKENFGERAALHDGSGHAKTWRVLRKSGQLQATEDAKAKMTYEVAVAIPEVGQTEPTTLFSYFPTAIPFPLRVLAHATLALEQNRKQPQASETNSEIFRSLARWLVETVESWQTEHSHERAAGLQLLTRAGDWPPAFIHSGWAEALVAEMRQRSLVPVLDGRHVIAKEARRLSGASTHWLPVSIFGDITSESGSAPEAQLLSEIGVSVLTSAEFSERAQRVKWESIRARGRFISGIIRHRLPVETHTSALLLDSTGAPIPEKCRVFLPSEKGGEIPLPTWASIRFLNLELRDALSREMGLTEQRELQRLLQSFGVREWGLGNVCEALVAAANDARRHSQSDDSRITAELLQTLLALFLAESGSRQRPAFPEKAALKIPTQRSGTMAGPEELYICGGLGARGELLQSLYGNWAPEKLIGIQDSVFMGLENDTKTEFLRWLGVQDWPRVIETVKIDEGYKAAVLRSVTFPADFGDRFPRSPAEIAGATVSKAQTIDGLVELLRYADSDAVLAWLALDSRAASWKVPSPLFAELRWHRGGDWSARTYKRAVPSYARWILQHTSWLPTQSGVKSLPGKCLVGERSIGELLSTPAKPTEATWEKFRVPPEAVREAWDRAGVMLGFACAPWVEVYHLLGDLPVRDPEGRIARSLYRIVMDQSDSFLGDAEAAGKIFRETGQLWGVRGQQGKYWPVTQLRYLSIGALPGLLVSSVPLVAVDRKEGSRKVERLFGVKPVESAKIHVTVLSLISHADAETARDELARAKPWLWALREARGGSDSQRRDLVDLRVEICTDVKTQVAYEGHSHAHVLAPWEVLRVKNVIYASVPSMNAADLRSDLLARAIGDEIAAYLGDSHGDDFGWLLRCAELEREVMLKKLIPAIEQPKADAWPLQPLPALAYHEPPAPPPSTPPPESTPVSSADTSPPVAQRIAGPVIIEQLPHVPEPPSERSPLFIQPLNGGNGGGSPSGGARQVTDWAYCEQMAAVFEENAHPPRYPVRVGHITGYEGARCDVISFMTAEARAEYLRMRKVNPEEVARFIEVKARADERARILLKENALDAAQAYGDRYFLYRFHQEADKNLTLTILQNPLKQAGAQPIWEIDLDRSAATKWRLRQQPASDASERSPTLS